MRHITTPVTVSDIRELVRGDQVLLSGRLYTARDAAHKRLLDRIAAGKKLPVNLDGQFLYYTGPSPAQRGEVIGSAGPTTSSRMDAYTPDLIAASGLRGLIGKGNRTPLVVEALRRHGCVYFAATGGAGSLLGGCIRKAGIVCYEDLGPEAVYELEVVNFPLVVAIDTNGGNCYVDGPAEWKSKNTH
jgi:fumarate hydratase subunit beta